MVPGRGSGRSPIAPVRTLQYPDGHGEEKGEIEEHEEKTHHGADANVSAQHAIRSAGPAPAGSAGQSAAAVDEEDGSGVGWQVR
mgnify:CR=1 FL=1